MTQAHAPQKRRMPAGYPANAIRQAPSALETASVAIHQNTGQIFTVAREYRVRYGQCLASELRRATNGWRPYCEARFCALHNLLASLEYAP